MIIVLLYYTFSHKGKIDPDEAGSNIPQSPKHRNKLKKHFWTNGAVPNNTSNSLKNHRQTMDDSAVTNITSSIYLSAEAEEIARRRAFTHFDCQSLTTNLNYTVRLRKNILAKRRNTATGASAASMFIRYDLTNFFFFFFNV